MASSTVGAHPSFSTLAISTNKPIVSVDWLHANIRDPDLKMLDGLETLLSREELEKKIGQEGISLDKTIVASCGTGVTACILVLGLHRLGKTGIPFYDGSWIEWATQTDTRLSTYER